MRRLIPPLMAALLLLAPPLAARAGGGLSVSPLSVDFQRGTAARTVEVSNPGDQPVTVQVRLFAWRVDRDGEHYVPSQDVAFSPPMFVLAPGAIQTVRLAPRVPDAATERAYRLFVDQVPAAAAPGQLQMPVRMVLPLFLEAGGEARPDALRWRLEFDRPRQEAILIAANDGARRVRVTDLAYLVDGRPRPLRPGLAGYVLAGEEMGWRFPVPARLSVLDVAAQTDFGPIRARIPFPAD